MCQVTLWPNEIRYSHSSMGAHFMDGTKVSDTFRDLMYGNITVEDIDPIHVFPMNRKYYVISGNKRLRVYKRLQAEGALTQPVPVVVRSSLPGAFERVFTTENDGTFIYHPRSLNAAFRAVASAWRRTSRHKKGPVSVRCSPLPTLTVRNLLQNPRIAGGVTAQEKMERCLRLSRRNIRSIERHTTFQHNNIVWRLFRAGRITASVFDEVLRCIARGRGGVSKSLMKKLLGQENDLSHVKEMKWGVDHEPVAIRAYENKYRVKVKPCGIFLHTSGMLGASPDGMVGRSKIIEVKCPYSRRQTGIKKSAGSNFYITKSSQGDFMLNLDDRYGRQYHNQIQGTMYMTGATECDLVVWSEVDFVVIPIARDADWQENIEYLIDFYRSQFLPALLEKSGAGDYHSKSLAGGVLGVL